MRRRRPLPPPLSPSKRHNTQQANDSDDLFATPIEVHNDLVQLVAGSTSPPVRDDEDGDSEGDEDEVMLRPVEVEDRAGEVLVDLERSQDTPMNTGDLCEIRRQLYQEHAREKFGASKAVAKRQVEELDPELMDFINAKYRGLGCRRTPIKLYFGSDEACESVSSFDRLLYLTLSDDSD